MQSQNSKQICLLTGRGGWLNSSTAWKACSLPLGVESPVPHWLEYRGVLLRRKNSLTFHLISWMCGVRLKCAWWCVVTHLSPLLPYVTIRSLSKSLTWLILGQIWNWNTQTYKRELSLTLKRQKLSIRSLLVSPLVHNQSIPTRSPLVLSLHIIRRSLQGHFNGLLATTQ